MTTARAYANVTGPTATFTGPDGHTEPVFALGADDIRLAVVQRTADEARRTGEPVELITTGDRGRHHLLVDTQGGITSLDQATDTATAPGDMVDEVSDEPSIPAGALRRSERLDPEDVDESIAADIAASAPALRRSERADVPDTATSELTETRTSEVTDSGAPEVTTRRKSFIADPNMSTTPTSGFRGLLANIGIKVQPSPADLQRERDTTVVSRQWAGCRTIAVVNGKGGVGKTMTTAMLAAVFARNGGGNVLAWDNNDTRGTLGWRTESGLYDTTIRDLLPAAEELLTPSAWVSHIARFVHHQNADRYDVLRSNPELLAADQRIDADEFELLMQVAARYYRLVIFDSGNDESADRWIRMIDDSYRLVLPTLKANESAETAALLLEELRRRDERSAALADNAVVVVSQYEPGSLAAERRIADGFRDLVRDVQIVPFDPALKSGPLRFDTLRPRTQDAWLRIASVTAESL
ncbi:MAG: AAA family ATPase [Microbacterium sp.]|nr:AAA family ATPase [Microbacterium sp.]